MFLSSLFSLALTLNTSHLAIEIVREDGKKPRFSVYLTDPLNKNYRFAGKLSAATLFSELRNLGIDIDTTKQYVGKRLRTDWNARGVRYQARVSFYPSSRIEVDNRQGAGVMRFDNMRIFSKPDEQPSTFSDRAAC